MVFGWVHHLVAQLRFHVSHRRTVRTARREHSISGVFGATFGGRYDWDTPHPVKGGKRLVGYTILPVGIQLPMILMETGNPPVVKTSLNAASRGPVSSVLNRF